MKDQRPPSTYPMQQPLHVAVLEDNIELRQDILIPGLRDHGFNAHGAANATELYRMMAVQHVDIAVLDIGLPGEDGISVAKQLRDMWDIGIVMLTGRTGRLPHLHSLRNGADSFLSKPVDLDVLAATVHSIGRRMSSRTAAGVAEEPAGGRWRLEADGWRLVSPRGKIIALTSTEQRLIGLLAVHNGQTVMRDTLIEGMTTDVFEFDPHRLEMVVHRLRRKTQARAKEPPPILTVRGSGYLISCDIEVPGTSVQAIE